MVIRVEDFPAILNGYFMGKCYPFLKISWHKLYIIIPAAALLIQLLGHFPLHSSFCLTKL